MIDNCGISLGYRVKEIHIADVNEATSSRTGGIGLTIHEAYRMRELDEVLGPLNSFEEAEGWLLASIGKIPVLLPIDLQDRLQSLLGKRIGVLRLDGYRLRCLDEKMA